MDILHITVWREARGEGFPGMNAVAHVIQNRSLLSPDNGWPADMEKVCLQADQFSCWNDRDPQRNLYPKEGDPSYQTAKLCPTGIDPTAGCTSYYDISIPPPKESIGRTIIAIGRFRFYKVV